MKLSRSTGYALLAVGYIAQCDEKKVVLSQEISRKYDIPLEYLLKILQQLVRANVLHSKRGPKGGYSLAKSSNKITILQIVEAVDGPLISQMNLAEQTKKEKYGLRADKLCEKATNQARAVLNQAKLSDLL